ncbi:MAG: ferritin-like domain-containing protein [Polyangiaceae bacterium]|nr:ferritin-like domain-containing protein [Polyangiaceae bacterium]
MNRYDETADIELDLTQEASLEKIELGNISILTVEERSAAVLNWKNRMVSEHVSARVFAGFFDKMVRAGLPARHLNAAQQGMAEELSHAVLCGRVLQAFGERASAPLPNPLPQVERHEDASPIEAVLRDAISIGACSETVAVALVGTEREQAASDGLRAVLDQILTDEVGHSRLGWKLLDEYLPRLGAREKKRLSRYLVDVFEHQLAFHKPFVDLPPMTDTGVAFGAPDGPSNFEVFVHTMTTITVPGLAARGLAANEAWNKAITHLRAHKKLAGTFDAAA